MCRDACAAKEQSLTETRLQFHRSITVATNQLDLGRRDGWQRLLILRRGFNSGLLEEVGHMFNELLLVRLHVQEDLSHLVEDVFFSGFRRGFADCNGGHESFHLGTEVRLAQR